MIPARPRTPTDKGKVEKRIRDVFDRIDIHNHIFDSLQQVQQYLDRTVADLEHEWLSGATGCSVYDSFSFERKALKSLPAHFPPLPVKEQRKTVYKDGLVYFDGNYYQLPAQYRKQKVLCVHTGQKILIYHGNELIADFAVLAGSKNMVRLNPQAIEDDNVHLSKPVRQWAMEVALRQVEWYEQLVQQRDGHGY